MGVFYESGAVFYTESIMFQKMNCFISKHFIQVIYMK